MAEIKYTKADKLKIKQLTEAGKTLSGTESPDELETLVTALNMEEAESEDTKAEEIEGIPNKLPVRTVDIMVGNKVQKLAVYFIATVKDGKLAMYDYNGNRCSPAYGSADMLPGSENTKGQLYIGKAVAKFNAMRQKNIIPGEQIG